MYIKRLSSSRTHLFHDPLCEYRLSLLIPLSVFPPLFVSLPYSVASEPVVLYGTASVNRWTTLQQASMARGKRWSCSMIMAWLLEHHLQGIAWWLELIQTMNRWYAPNSAFVGRRRETIYFQLFPEPRSTLLSSPFLSFPLLVLALSTF